MTAYDYDLFVIGAGSGGVRAARMSAQFGARVAIAEERFLGGTCVNVGCVPKKLFVYASSFAEEFAVSKHYGWTLSESDFSWQQLIANKNKEIGRLNDVYRRILENASVKIIDGRAALLDQHTVAIDNTQFSAERILVATGSWPYIPDFPGSQHVISSNEAFFLPHLPKRLIIVGGGYIAVEFACLFNKLGVATTLIYRGPLFLRGFDHDVREHLAKQMSAQGINLQFDCDIVAVQKTPNELQAELSTGTSLASDLILYATGRLPKAQNLGLEALGVQLDAKGAIIVNTNHQSSIPTIYALGDVTHRVNLTPVALAEGMALAKSLFGKQTTHTDYSNIPSSVFSQPNIATVGLTEEQARVHYTQVEIYKSEFTSMKLSLTNSTETVLMKLIVDKESNRVVGAHMVGPDAGEIIQGIAIAIKAGATKADFDATIGIHPTLAEEFVTMREPFSD